MKEKKTSSFLFTEVCAGILLFTLCGFAGWLYETALTSYLWGEFAKRGFLHVPILPIYGVFAFIMLPIFKKHNGWGTVFFGGMIITTVLELISSYIIEAVIHRRLWNYSSWDFNFQGRISLYSSLVFGAMSLLLIKGAYPIVQKFKERVSDKVVRIMGMSCAVVIISDFIYCSTN